MTMFTQRKVQSSPTRRRILIVDDHPLVRRGLKALIDAEPDLIVCGEAATPEDGLRAIAARPDLVVVDLSLARGDGLTDSREPIRYEGLRVLALTMHEAPLYVRRVSRPAPAARHEVK
jgi:DNA-binding NarL/FixJ family response regulator